MDVTLTGSTEVVRTVGHPCENPVEMPVTAMEPIERWLRAQAHITLL